MYIEGYLLVGKKNLQMSNIKREIVFIHFHIWIEKLSLDYVGTYGLMRISKK